jgi:arylsulfatase A-like enzyme
MGWDQHLDLPANISKQCRDTDQPSAGLIQDLEQRGLLEDTLVIWGGEFGRTVYSQGPLTATNYGRDHHPRCFTIWLAGAGICPGKTYGETDDFSYNIVRDPVHVHDLQATMLHLLGLDHERLIYRFQGRDYRLTDVHGEVVQSILS